MTSAGLDGAITVPVPGTHDTSHDPAALAKIAEESGELGEATAAAEPDRVRDELGDLLFAVVNVARHLDIDPESALRAATQKFRTRFEAVEVLARARGIELAEAGLGQLDALWEEVKRR